MAVTVVYIDRVAVLNLMVDYLLLMTTATLAGTPLRRLRFGLCAVGGSAYAVAVFLLPVLAHPLCRIGAGIVMALCAFGEEVRPWRLTALFWLLSVMRISAGRYCWAARLCFTACCTCCSARRHDMKGES